ncbi:MAG: TraR/DksA C4-type zinc finger protein, partial [Brevundimonas sp.]
MPTGPGRDTCRECGDPIPAARRRAMPGAVTCVS